MSLSAPRVVAPETVAKGEVFQIKALITHQMETGLRRDETGTVIPRKIINEFACRYDGDVVFRVELHEAMAANPYLEFYAQAIRTGTLEFSWHEDGGAVYTATRNLVVI